MAAKKVRRVMKIVAMGGKADPSKLGQKLGPYGIGPKFCMEFNAKTADRAGELVPCILTIYDDRTFDLVLKTSPVTFLLKKAAGLEKGRQSDAEHMKNGVKGKDIVGHVTRKQVEEIANYKMVDLNVNSLEAAVASIKGTASSMGIVVDD